jgi:type III pantothenate kinase
MRVLTLDVGNTTVDACLWEEGRLVHLGRFRHLDPSLKEGKWDKVVVLSVRPSVNEDLFRAFGGTLKLITPEDIPVPVDYKTRETLGTDRVLFAYASKEFYSENALLVSAGTALVVDLLLDGVFRGGFITAGIGLKLRALHRSAEGIPDLRLRKLEVSLGRTTEECVVGGVLEEARAFVRETLGRWSRAYRRDLEVIVTGGDGWLLEDLGTYDPLILHRGMLRILGCI